MNKFFLFFLIIIFVLPVYSNNFVINSNKNNVAQTLHLFTSLQQESSLNKIRTKLNNNHKAQALLDELKNYLIANDITLQDFNELIPIRKITIDTIPNVKSDKTQISFQSDFSNQWYMNICNIKNAWKIATGEGIIVAVLDTGIDYYNKDFRDKLWVNTNEDINKNNHFDAWRYTEEQNGIFGDIDGVDNDNNGYIDDIIGFDFVNEIVPTFGDVKYLDGDPNDEHGHGTQVASVISAIAPDAKIMAVRIHNASGQSDCIAIANGIIYAVLNGANIINLSSGEEDTSPLIFTAIKFAVEMGVVVVCSAGNDGNTLPHYPSDYSEVISVGGINENEMHIFNYGDFIDITAPATNIYVGDRNNSYRTNSGTSFSTPIVSGICALLLSKKPDLSPAEVKTQIQLSARSESGWSPEFGAGIIDAKKCLEFVGTATLKIESPTRAEIIDISKQNYLTIKGTIALPLFENYIVRIRNCRESKNNCPWDTLIKGQYLQIISDELCKINLQEKNILLGENIISVLCNLKSGRTIEERTNIFIVGSNTKLIDDAKIFSAYYNDNIIGVVNIKTSKYSSAKLFYKLKNDDTLQYTNSVDYITTNHTIMLDNLPLLYDCDTVYIEVQYGDIIETAPIMMDDILLPNISNNTSAQMKKQLYTIPYSHLYKEKVTKNGEDYLIASLFDNNGSPTKIKHFQALNNDSIYCVDSTNYNGVCASIIDDCILSNFYGCIQWHNYSNRRTISIGEENSWDSSFIGIDLIDIDAIYPNDIIYRDNNGTFFTALINENAVNRKKIFNYYDFIKQNADIDLLKPHNQFSICKGNFYGDNKNYIAVFTTNDPYFSLIEVGTGDAKLKEIVPISNHYHNELVHKDHRLNQSIFVRNGDIDGDGIDELIYMYYGKIDDTSDVLGKYEVWTIYVYKNENGSFVEVASENIFGVRVATPYLNGLNTGDLDNDGSDEILVCCYPNLYVFKWNNENKKLIPFWYYPECHSNVAVVGDFNGNGKNEICFNNFSETIFFEFENHKPHSVFNFVGYAKDKNSATFSWKSFVDISTEYELLLIETDNLSTNNFKKYLTSETHIDIDNLREYTHYTVFVRVNGDVTLYNPIEIFTNDATSPVDAEAINSKIVKIKFSDRISLDLNNNANGIKLISEDNNFLSSVNLMSQSDSSLIVEFNKEILNGTYKLKIPVFSDIYGNPTIQKELNITIDIYFVSELFLTYLLYEPPLTLIVSFSESIDTSALNVNNYSLHPYGSIENILLVDDNTIKIFLQKNMQIYGRGKDYLLTAHTNISALSGNKMTHKTGNALGFCMSENNFDSIYVYPAPISLTKHTEAYIARLPNNTIIEILNQFGNTIKKLNETDGNGGIDWDLTDEQGNKCDIGIYFVRISYHNSDEQKLVKFTIVR